MWTKEHITENTEYICKLHFLSSNHKYLTAQHIMLFIYKY